MSSAFTMEKILADAKSLVMRLKDYDTTTNSLLTQTQQLGKRVDAMKTYQENIGTLNEMAKQRQPVDLVLGLFQENSEIGDLHRENACLRYSLDEHQLAIELIMSRYREQVAQLVTANRIDRAKLGELPDHAQEIESKVGQICNMADVMRTAVDVDSTAEINGTEQLTQLRFENATLRDLLTVGRQSLASLSSTRATQTDRKDLNVDRTSTDDDSVNWNTSGSSTMSYSVQSVARKFGSHRMRISAPVSSSNISDCQTEEHPESSESHERSPHSSNESGVQMADDIDDTYSGSSGASTPVFNPVDIRDLGDNISVLTLDDDDDDDEEDDGDGDGDDDVDVEVEVEVEVDGLDNGAD